MSDGDSDDGGVVGSGGGVGGRAAKKRKASRACDRCNSQHQPCDNAAPRCGVCARAGTACTYDRPVRKRGPRSGYTGQNGERLWAVVLRARPELEDVVLQALRAGTYGDSGVPNLEYYRNNDNQAELVGRFNESRLGRFLQHGESAAADLNLPPLDADPLPLPLPLPSLVSSFNNHHRHRSDTVGSSSQNSSSHNNTALRQPGSAAAQAIPHQNGRRMSSSSGANSVIVNPHGAPQNPSDIYLQSEDIRRRAFVNPPQDSSVSVSGGGSYQGSPAVQQSTGFGSSNGYDFKANSSISVVSDGETTAGPSYDNNNSIASVARQGNDQNASTKPGSSDLGTPYHSRWLDSIPRDTLLNLGFAPGEGMEEDFFELCANPDPIELTPTNFADGQGEDEEAVWRRLVMRGRFV